MFGLFGCTDKKEDNDPQATAVKKYKVFYEGSFDWYQNAKEEYAAGEQVELYYNIIATDTDYSFTLDGGPLNYTYDEEKGFIIRFTMPEHDVTLTRIAKNSMEYIPPTEEADVMLIDSYRSIGAADDDGGGYDEITVNSYDTGTVKMIVYHQEGEENEVVTNYIVPYEVVEKCYEVIEKHKLRSWKKLTETESLDGALLVCKFKDGDEYVRVTSEKMPADGEAAFTEIEAILKSYIKDEYLAAE